VSSYRDGYSDCAREVATYLGQLDSPGGVLVRTRVLAHLSARLRAVNSAHRRQQAPPASSQQQLPVSAMPTGDERCRVTTTSCGPAASSTSDVRGVAPPATGTCRAEFKSYSTDGATTWSDAVLRPTTPIDEKQHVTTTTVTSLTYHDVNGNDVTTRVSVHQRSTPPAAVTDDGQDTSPVWRPW